MSSIISDRHRAAQVATCALLYLQIGSTRIRTRAALAYALFKKGPLTSTGCDHGAFINTLSACTMHAASVWHSLLLLPVLRSSTAVMSATCRRLGVDCGLNKLSAQMQQASRTAPGWPNTIAGVGPDSFGLRCAGGQQPDLQVRFVPAASLDPDGVGSYVLFGQLAKLGLKYPSGFTFQVQLLSLSPVPRLPDRAAQILLRLTICQLNSVQPACRATHSHPSTILDRICHSFVAVVSGPRLCTRCTGTLSVAGLARPLLAPASADSSAAAGRLTPEFACNNTAHASGEALQLLCCCRSCWWCGPSRGAA
jgi:hypothetical protein